MEKKYDEDKAIEKIQEKLKSDDNIEIPDSLKPENIEKMLEGASSTNTKTGKKKSWKAAYSWVAAAACFVLLIGGVIGGRSFIRSINGIGNASSESTASSIADSSTADATESASLDADTPENTLATAKDYDEIYKYFQQQETSNDVATYTSEAQVTNEAAANASGAVDGAGVASSAKSSTSDASGYSDTNVRAEGVGEADVVKTDGNYIYTLKDGLKIQIVDIRNPEMALTSEIDLSSDGYVSEIYIANGKLYVFYTEDVSSADVNNYEYRTNTCIKTFDVSNPAEPKEIAKVSQSGDYYTMRVVGDYIYLFSQYYVYGVGEKDDITQYIPYVQGKEMAPDRIYIPPTEVGSQYMIITSINMNQADEVYDSKAMMSSTGTCYVSTNSIYMCDYVYSDEEDYNQTAIRKLNYKDGNLTAVGQTKVWGSVNDSFSIDEYNGYLRLVTTVSPITHYDYTVQPIISPFQTLKDFVTGDATADSANSDTSTKEVMENAEDTTAYDSDKEEESDSEETEDSNEKKDSNALYILDENLNQVSKLEGMAKDERIYSARFTGDVAYFVTYKQVDPLFSADLSDPKNPKIIGELKIPGFSEYLHPYSDGLLLGIGMDVDETGTVTNGVKLSMFNTSDPANVSEINKQVLGNIYGSNVFYEYKAVLIDAEKNLIGFSANGDTQHYYVYSYDANSGFTCLLDRDIGNGWYGTIRGLYSGDRLYIVEGYAIESYDLTTFDKIDDIVL